MEKNLYKIHLIGSILLLVLLSVSTGYYYISSEFKQFNTIALDIEDRYMQEQKDIHLKGSVDGIMSIIETEKVDLYKEIQKKLTNRANLVTQVSNKVYDDFSSQTTLSQDVIKENVISTARTFNWSLNPTDMEVLEGIVDNGYIVENIDNNEYAIIFVPIQKINITFKLSVNLYELKNEFKSKVLEQIKQLSENDKDKIFIFDTNSSFVYNSYLTVGNFAKMDTNVQKELFTKLATNNENGKFEEYINNDGEKQYYYAKDFKYFDWVIASYINISDIKKATDNRNSQLKTTTTENIKTTIMIFAIFAFTALIFLLLFTNKIAHIFRKYQQSIQTQKEEIKNANELLNTIIDSTEDIIAYKDINFKYIMCNKAFCNFLEKTKEEIIGKEDSDLFDIDIVNILREEDTFVINNSESIYVEHILKDSKGNEVYFYTNKTLLKDKDDNIMGLVSFARNFTATQNLINQLSSTNQDLEEKVKQRTIELEKLNHNLEERVVQEVEKNRQKDKIVQNSIKQAQMGEMLSMIAHQWRQPLSTISTIGAGMRIELELGVYTESKLIQELRQIEQHTQFLSRTINDFRNFFNPNKLKEDVLLGDIIDKSISIFAKNIENNGINLTKNYEFKDKISIYSNEFMQVILNLIKNSIDVFVERNIKNPKITINGLLDDNYQIIEVIDNGGGIDENVLDKIFDPYFSTKDEKNGTGLGLYMSRVIVEDHCGGKIDVQNYEDGCRFIIKLKK